MRRRIRPRRRAELRRAAIDRLSFDFRVLSTAATARTSGEPSETAGAIEVAYDGIQRLHPATARAMHPYEVRRLTDQSFALCVKLALMNLDIQRPAVLEHRRSLSQEFAERLGQQWDRGLDELRILHEVAFEASRAFHDATQTASVEHEALARLQARGLAIAEEILCLLDGGFASGAMARWRTLHETMVTAAVVAAGGEALADRYLDHEIVSRWKRAREYQRRAEALGEEPLDADELQDIGEQYEKLLTRHGRGFRHDYGWVNGATEDRSWTFRDLEELAGQDNLRPYYQWANQPVHAGSLGLLREIGAIDEQVLVTGPTDRGLADPGQLTAVTLVALTRTFVLSRRGLGTRWLIYVDALDILAKRVATALRDAHVASGEAEGSLGAVSAVDQDARSLLAWPAVEREDYERVFAGVASHRRRMRRRGATQPRRLPVARGKPPLRHRAWPLQSP